MSLFPKAAPKLTRQLTRQLTGDPQKEWAQHPEMQRPDVLVVILRHRLGATAYQYSLLLSGSAHPSPDCTT
jgi:hypothetical protein